MSELTDKLQIRVLAPEEQPDNQTAKAAHRLRHPIDTDLDESGSEPEQNQQPESFADDTAPNADSGRQTYVEIPEKVQSSKDDGKAKSGPPTVAEWQDFIGRTVLRFMTDGYLTLVLKDVEPLLTDREREQIRLSRDDLKELAAPMAELANKSPALRKKGRLIVASADSVEAVWTLVFWMRRVNRIANRHRAEVARQQTINARVMQPPANPNTNERMNNGVVRENTGQGNPGTAGNNGSATLYNPGTG